MRNKKASVGNEGFREALWVLGFGNEGFREALGSEEGKASGKPFGGLDFGRAAKVPMP